MEKRVQDYSKEILKIIRSNTSPAVMAARLQDYHENDLADVMPKLTVQERCKLYRILDTDMLSDIFEYTDEENAAEYLNEMDVKKAAAILSKMETDALADVLNKVEKTKKKILIDLLEPEVRRDVEMIASFDEDEIGSRMTTNYIVITDKLTVKQAMSSLIEQAAKNDNISTIFVVTEQQKFYGAINLKELIIARRDDLLENLVVTSYPYVYAEENIDDCIEELKDYSEDSIPVLDNDNQLLGVITSASIIDLVDDEMGDDYAKLAGLTAEEDLNETTGESIRKRLPWLVILTVMALLFLGAYIHLFKGFSLGYSMMISACVGVSLVGAMVVSSLVGTLTPIFFKKVGVDPAVASGPLITTINDLVAVVTYYGLSWIFLIEMLHLAG